MKHSKSQYPTNTTRNDYSKNRKKSVINTPPKLADFVHRVILSSKFKFDYVFDIGCGTGNLSWPWRVRDLGCKGIDNRRVRYHSSFTRGDFLSPSFCWPITGDALILCNPPFNNTTGSRDLLPEKFLERIVLLYGALQPVILFAPMGMRLNQRVKSSRWRWIRDSGLTLSSIISLPIDIYGQGVQVHSEILIFNIPGLSAHYFLPDWVTE